MKEITQEEPGIWDKVHLTDFLGFLSNSNNAYPFARLSLDKSWKENIALRVSFEISNTSMEKSKNKINPDDGVRFLDLDPKNETSSKMLGGAFNYISDELSNNEGFNHPYNPSEYSFQVEYPIHCENSPYSPLQSLETGF